MSIYAAAFLLFQVLAAPSSGATQGALHVTVTPLGVAATKEFFAGHVARKLVLCSVNVRNNTDGQQRIAQEDVLAAIPEYLPIDNVTAQLVAARAEKLAWSAWVGRGLVDLSKLSALLIAAKVIAASNPWLIVATGFASLAPQVTARVVEIEPPIAQNFALLGWRKVMDLAPGASDSRYLFIVKQATIPPPIRLVASPNTQWQLMAAMQVSPQPVAASAYAGPLQVRTQVNAAPVLTPAPPAVVAPTSTDDAKISVGDLIRALQQVLEQQRSNPRPDVRTYRPAETTTGQPTVLCNGQPCGFVEGAR